ncbi:hypothetical protein BS47DRAFT_1365960 [Hydnum rufescens UP504]|uniref:Uncharacterized protein n=1 Tax=Hydnum rufescens UP504 TaxID=1448309 RepID=A0A9P6DRG2_9AGAM|nr:hypothetical protein BS47DRAFT_1365960 [Hydnum rufescens UP504]
MTLDPGQPRTSTNDRKRITAAVLGSPHGPAEASSLGHSEKPLASEDAHGPWKICKTQKAIDSLAYIQAKAALQWGQGSKTWGNSSATRYLQILLHHLPDASTIASEDDYLGSTIYTSFDDWQQALGTDNFGDYLVDELYFGPVFKDVTKHAFGDCCIAEAAVTNFSKETFKNSMDGSVFWGTGGAVTKIPDIIQSAFAYCPVHHDPGLINKALVDVMNMAKQTYE